MVYSLSSRRSDNLGHRWRLQLSLQCKLELKVIHDDKLKLLPDGSRLTKL